jgi:Glycosyltransferases involved in cell wall biogenesis
MSPIEGLKVPAPSISICLPVFNGSRFLGIAIESVLNQEFDDFELIIIDDCSTDDSEDVVARYLHDPRVIYSRNQQRLGLFRNYNECMNRSRAPFVKLFAQDDVFAPSLLNRMRDVLDSEPNVALVSVAKRWIDSEGQAIEPRWPNEKAITRKFDQDTCVSRQELFKDTISSFVNWAGEPSTIMLRREAIDKGFDSQFRQIGDLEYWYRVLRHGDYYYIADRLCDFRIHNRSATSRNTPLAVLCDYTILGMKYQDDLKEIGLSLTSFYQGTLAMLAQEKVSRLNSGHPYQEDDSQISDLWNDLLNERDMQETLSDSEAMHRQLALAGFIELSRQMTYQLQLTKRINLLEAMYTRQLSRNLSGRATGCIADC